MFKKFGIGLLAVVLAVSFSAFTAPKTPANGKNFNPILYWYVVDKSIDAVPQGATYFKQDEAQNVTSPCPETLQQVDCIRGFANTLSTSAGPVYTAGDDHKMTEDPNP